MFIIIDLLFIFMFGEEFVIVEKDFLFSVILEK